MKDIVTEQFVNELVQSNTWIKVDKADPINENRRETSVPDSTGAVDETEEISAQDFAVELLENIAPEVILEFINILHEELINELAENGDSDNIDEDGLMSALAGGAGSVVGAFKGAGDTYKIRRDISRRGEQKRAEEVGASREARKGVKHRYGAGIDAKFKRFISGGHAGQGIRGYEKQTRLMGTGGRARIKALHPTSTAWSSAVKKKTAAKGSGTDVEAATRGSTGQTQAAQDLSPEEVKAQGTRSRKANESHILTRVLNKRRMR